MTGQLFNPRCHKNARVSRSSRKCRLMNSFRALISQGSLTVDCSSFLLLSTKLDDSAPFGTPELSTSGMPAAPLFHVLLARSENHFGTVRKQTLPDEDNRSRGHLEYAGASSWLDFIHCEKWQDSGSIQGAPAAIKLPVELSACWWLLQ